MLSTGNDIVALDYIDVNRSNDRRFYSKILSASEQELYHSSGFSIYSFDKYLWLLWSVKESAFKYINRNQPDLIFSPTRIIINQINFPVHLNNSDFTSDFVGEIINTEHNFSGHLIFGSKYYYFNSKINQNYIATVVSEDEKFEFTQWGIASIKSNKYEHQSKEVRSFFLKQMALQIPGFELKVEKNKVGCPLIYNGSSELEIPVSFAHHGRYISYSFYNKYL
jgi:phosphopantetheinyl transferase (holo-ACP synthase)